MNYLALLFTFQSILLKYIMPIFRPAIHCFVWVVVLLPSQELSPCRDGQFFLGKLRINRLTSTSCIYMYFRFYLTPSLLKSEDGGK